MKTLIAWDDPSQAELLSLYLGMEGNDATVCLTPEEFEAQQQREGWDAVFMALTFPKTAEEGYAHFQQLKENFPTLPLVIACRPTEMMNLPRFLTNGLRYYLIRDDNGDFVFLAVTSIESAVAAARAEESRKLATMLRDEMDGVRRMQESIIPRGLNPPPGYEITARYEPAQVQVGRETPVVMAGGDYYDLFRPDDEHLVMLVGDASGHGLKACMSIMAMHTLIRMFMGSRYQETATFVAEINQQLCENSIVQSGGGFITLFYAAVDTVNHLLHWSSAGHPLALIHILSTNEVIPVGIDTDAGLPLGIFPDQEYSSNTLPMPPGSRLLIYSDGLTDALPQEAGDNKDLAFGIKGVMETLRACRTLTLEETIDRLFQDSSSFTGGVGRHDDTSMVLLQRTGS